MPGFIGFIPTPYDCIDGFFDLAPVSASDVVYDLGSGDGRLLFAALRRGAGKVVGIELDAELVKLAKKTAVNKHVDDIAVFLEEDILNVNLTDATVIFCYLFPTASEALKPKFEKELKRGARIVMESFPIWDWKTEKMMENRGKSFYLYIMPPEKIIESKEV
jgi:tRNA1(Val) A37 N6-methylase TrmN6